MSAKTIDLLRHPKNLKTLLEMLAFAAVMPILLKFYSLERFLGIITPSTKRQPDHIPNTCTEMIIHLGIQLLKRNRLFLKNSCLKRSLLLYYFLRKHGIEVYVHFGVKKIDGYLAGHSWLTQDGNLLADKGRYGEAFTSIISYPKHIEPIST
jgi:Transglutaminase-like superfamily